jgi:sugar transferase (PEP-CTERM system associated)
MPNGTLIENSSGMTLAGSGRVMPVRFFNGHVHSSMVLLALVEAAVAFGCVYLAVVARFGNDSASIAQLLRTAESISLKAGIISVVTLLSLASMGLYQLRQRIRFAGVVVRLLLAVVFAHIALAVIFYVAPNLFVGRGLLALDGAFTFAGLTLVRYAYLRMVNEDIFRRRVLVWGAGARASAIAKRLRRHTDQRGFKLIGYICAPGDRAEVPEQQLIQPEGTLLQMAARHRIEEIVVAPDDRRNALPIAELLQCRILGVEVSDIVAFFERESGRVSVSLMHPSWLIFSKGFRRDYVRLGTKRVFDIVVSLCILLTAAPIALLTAFAIFLEDRGPVLYRQLRVGQNGRLFRMLKFRSMKTDAEANGEAVWAQRNDGRVTRVGALIRKLRIDELPQVINVLVGHMSFVGPRPERPEFVERLTSSVPYYPERHSVKPGITGWAQVQYRYGASEHDAREKLEYDLFYVKHHSLALDLVVLLQTVEVVLFGIGSR